MGCLCVKPKVDYDMKLAENSLKLSQTRQAILEKSIKNMLDINQGFDNETPNKSSNYKSNNVDSNSNYNSNFRNTDVSEVNPDLYKLYVLSLYCFVALILYAIGFSCGSSHISKLFTLSSVII